MSKLSIKETKDGNHVGLYYEDSIQWVSGIEYKKYCFQFDSVFRKLFPVNKTIYKWKNILVVGGGDMQLLSETSMLSEENVTTVVDPCAFEYQEVIKNSEIGIPSYIKSNQIKTFDNRSFTTYIPITIQEYLASDNYASETYDLIIVDLIDEYSVDEDNEFTSLLWNRLRSGGIIMGYGGVSSSNFLLNSPLMGYEIEDLCVEVSHFKEWEDDCVVYGVRKA